MVGTTVETLRLLDVGGDFPEHLLEGLKRIVMRKFRGRPPEQTRVNVVYRSVTFEFRVWHEGADFLLKQVGSHTVPSLVVLLVEQGT